MGNLKGLFSMSLLRISILVVTLIHIVYQADGYSGGAPQGICNTMIPGHGADPQKGENPYIIKVSKTNVGGTEEVDITLTSVSGNEDFKGFLIHARKPDGSDQAFGSFNEVVAAGNAQTVNCFDKPKSAMTHVSGEPKKSVTVQWIAPNDEDGEYQIYFSVVKQYEVYWTHKAHPEKIRVTRDIGIKTTPKPGPSNDLLELYRKAYTDCGKTKGCFGMPSGCIENYDPTSDDPVHCNMMVTWQKNVDNIYEIIGDPNSAQMGYVALGLSDDKLMGADSVAGCGFTSGGQPSVKRYHNPGKTNKKNSNDKLGLEQLETKRIDTTVYCKFKQVNHDLSDIKVDIDNKNYYLLMSKNTLVKDGADAGLGQHASDADKGVSPQAVHITDNIIIGASSNTWLVQLHGGLMVIAWLLCASTGTFTARYFKLTHTDFMPCGKAFWFALHVFCMFSTIFLTICGSIFILIKKEGVYITDWHQALGVIVVGLGILQVIIAFFRPHPGTPKRPLFNWIHWGVGNSAHIVGLVCIILAWDLNLADLKRVGDKHLWLFLMLSVILFHVLMHIVMSIHTLWADKQMDSNNKKRAMQPGPMKSNGLNTEAPGTGFRTFMLSLYLFVMAAYAVALVVIIFWPKEDPTS